MSVLLSTTLAGAAQSQTSVRAQPPDVQAEQSARPDKDVRAAKALAPTAQQRSLVSGATVRWNALGTPATVTKAGAALATGLPADAEQAARAYLAANRTLFGLTADAVQSLEKVAVNPIGDGAAVLLRQRFGDLPAGHDGLVAVGVTDGTVFSVSSSLARDTAAPEAATLDQGAAVESAARDAGIAVSAAETRKTKLVAVPTA
ncbi:MAG: M36 family metallopeptidase, partial [Actinomadura sp.]